MVPPQEAEPGPHAEETLVADPASETEAGPAPRKRRALALGIAAALIAVAAGGGIGYAVLRHDDAADHKTAAAPWKAPAPARTGEFGAKSGGGHYGRLGKLLLPVPETYEPGPDVREFGNDVELDGKQAVAMMKSSVREMSKKNRGAVEKSIDDLHLQGAGMRTYSAEGGDYVIEIQIVQVTNKQAAAEHNEFFNEFTKAIGVFRNGPRITGHDKARCVLPPTEPGEKLDAMVCQATEGDLLVTMTVTGTVPLHKTEAADLLKEQLDRIQDPGVSA
ncbi:hypothetical protein G3I60_21735 [Streptomyces sp. SID13666]|uniref:hypothetical protein n=1 Tax=unclassified Streptomyces TaxID=2593676 RepID=UPI0013BF64D0|nr:MULTISPECIES: hypothetical protein [unclassified Streptomyces]NEA56686.1 hypothetical protein [Streptomyces sp. SID13666]NEA73130.1 hypothetical protein [Streptomyces sp. SID13588]